MTIIGRGERIVFLSLSILTLIFLLTPSVMLIASSLNKSSTLTFPPDGLTLQWYLEAFASLTKTAPGGAGKPLLTSLFVAIGSASIASLAGVPAAYGLARFRFPGHGIVSNLVSLPLVFPAMSFGVGLLALLSEAGIRMPYGRLIMANAVIVLPFVVRNVSASLSGINRSLEEAAWTLGATKLVAFAKIIVPLVSPGIVSGFLLSFIIAFNEVTIAFFLYTPEAQPFSIWVFQRTEAAFDTSLTAIGTVILVFNLLLVWILYRMSGGRTV